MSGPSALTAEEARLWRGWRTSTEGIVARVARAILEATGLSTAEYDVLETLADLGNGRLRQRELAIALGWDKSRISHQLTRMHERGLLRRSKSVEHGSRVDLSAAGRAALARARPVHADAVRRHLVDALAPGERTAILAIAARERASSDELSSGL